MESAPAALEATVNQDFAGVYDRFFHWVKSYFCRKGFSQDMAREFTQDVFLCVYQNGMHSAPKERMLPWLITVVQNKAISEHRRKWNSTVGLDDALPPEGPPAENGPGPTELLARQEETATLREQIRTMPEMMRKCLILKYYHDLSVEETAEVLGLSANTVKTHLKRALKQLRAQLRGDLAEEREGP